MTSETVLGFDVRVVGLEAEALWTAERRKLFLLRDVRLPLSVDDLAWPSAFSAQRVINAQAPWDLSWLSRPSWIGPNDCWDHLSAMEEALASAAAPPGRESWKIAFTWHVTGEFVASPCGGPYLETMSPPEREPSWTFLGYDVADPSISGLSDCGWTGLDPPREPWSAKLNDHHLLEKREDAFAFREMTNHRVPEHAPFHVIGLWKLP